jgi:prolipoprotein diacylglyceryl transferase
VLLAAIPAPPSNALHIGSLQFRFYGLSIALGVVAAVAIGRRRWAGQGGDPDDVNAIATWGVPAGLIGARLYHVLTDHQRFQGRWLHAFAVWEGGLGIPGGILCGVLGGVWIAHRRGVSVVRMLDVVAPAIPVAQAIGRLGNWFNQELFGGPTSLPWGLHVDVEHRPARWAQQTTFHPTFLYEALWNLALAGLVVLLGRRGVLKRGQAFFVYVGGYGVGRLWVEAMRVDPATHLFGLRVNIWVAGIFVLTGLAGFVICGRRDGSDEAPSADAPLADAVPDAPVGNWADPWARPSDADEPSD